ncbi:MAG TPA: hypothetical protein VFH11_13270 [Gemmatimonadota bacterium]|nr:hypothetical protein [Gemmatimonadota bacterium]
MKSQRYLVTVLFTDIVGSASSSASTPICSATAAAGGGRARHRLPPITKDAYSGPYNQHQLARIYILVGEHEKALDQLDPLRTNPRFQRLIAGG